jgi:hypothetical protein
LGSDQIIKTTTATLQDRGQETSHVALPRTIQDAADSTKKVGLIKLQVDCLCVVQDDIDEMAREMAPMPGIYGVAYRSLSAARSASSQKGVLHPFVRPDLDVMAFKLSFPCYDGKIGSVILASESERVDVKPGG